MAAPADFDELCSGLAGVQREACVTAASVIGPPDPALQMGLCAQLRPADAASCIRGIMVQNLIGASVADFVVLSGNCDQLAGRARISCYEWLGKTISVVTDGAFGERGCPELSDRDARRVCAAGAKRVEEALVTFS